MDIPTCFLFPVLKPSEFEAFTLIQSQSRIGMALHACCGEITSAVGLEISRFSVVQFFLDRSLPWQPLSELAAAFVQLITSAGCER